MRSARARISNSLLGPLCLALPAAWQEAGSVAHASEAQPWNRPLFQAKLDTTPYPTELHPDRGLEAIS